MTSKRLALPCRASATAVTFCALLFASPLTDSELIVLVHRQLLAMSENENSASDLLAGDYGRDGYEFGKTAAAGGSQSLAKRSVNALDELRPLVQDSASVRP